MKSADTREKLYNLIMDNKRKLLIDLHERTLGIYQKRFHNENTRIVEEYKAYDWISDKEINDNIETLTELINYDKKSLLLNKLYKISKYLLASIHYLWILGWLLYILNLVTL